MIPKIIHYCWFGSSEYSAKINFCMDTWKKVFPDYELRKWSEDDLDKIDNKYVKEAYEHKKWAFVSDVFRLYALKEYGGIYFDTDIEARKEIDKFLNHDFFIGTEIWKNKNSLATAVIGAKKGNALIQEMYDSYDNISFIKEDGSFDMVANPVKLTKVLMKHGAPEFYANDEIYEIMDNHMVYPINYFSTNNKKAYVVHHFEASWLDDWGILLKIDLPWFNNKRLKLLRYKKQKPNAKLEVSKKQKMIFSFSWNKKIKYVLVTE